LLILAPTAFDVDPARRDAGIVYVGKPSPSATAAWSASATTNGLARSL
jgi:hypothetical protein